MSGEIPAAFVASHPSLGFAPNADKAAEGTYHAQNLSWYAYYTMAQRMPMMIDGILRTNEYSTEVVDALQELSGCLSKGAAVEGIGEWLQLPWYEAEQKMFQEVLRRVHFHGEQGEGEGKHVDPFLGLKAESYASESIWTLAGSAALMCSEASDPWECLGGMLEFMVWGNQADLNHASKEYSEEHKEHAETSTAQEFLSAQRKQLVVNDGKSVLAFWQKRMEECNAAADLGDDDDARFNVHVICDNAGLELIMDLIFVWFVLSCGGLAHTVVFHCKHWPTYVSDTTISDVQIAIDRMKAAGGDILPGVAADLEKQLASDHFILRSHPFWNSTSFFLQGSEFPVEQFAHAGLIISKGDCNYRRIVADHLWPAVQSTFAEASAYFPREPEAALVALRTLKSDPVVGLSQETFSRLEREYKHQWRVDGRHGMVQAVIPTLPHHHDQHLWARDEDKKAEEDGKHSIVLWLVRHGQTYWNVEGRMQGQTDTELNDCGVEQAKRVAVFLAELVEAGKVQFFPTVYTSDLKRCRNTAAAIVDAINATKQQREHPLVLENVKGLREFHFGEISGYVRSDLEGNAELQAAIRKFSKDETYVVPGGESRVQHRQRVVRAIEAITTNVLRGKGGATEDTKVHFVYPKDSKQNTSFGANTTHVLVCSHGGSLKRFAEYCHAHVGIATNCSVSKFRCHFEPVLEDDSVAAVQGTWSVVDFANADHMLVE